MTPERIHALISKLYDDRGYDRRGEECRLDLGWDDLKSAFLALEKEVREECAKVCDLAARQYRQMKTSFIIEHGLYDDKEPDPDEAGDAECEELAYCCELNAKAIRAIGEDK